MISDGDWAAPFLHLWAVFGFCWNSVSHLDIRRLILEHGRWFYLITFVWTFVEGETFVIFAASFAAQGLLNPFILLLSAWLGSFSGDQAYFYIGRRFGGSSCSAIRAGAPASTRPSAFSGATARASC